MADEESPIIIPGGGQEKSLAYYAFWFMGLATVLIVAGIMAAFFWLSRPVNYSPETDRLADILETALRENFVPAANIERVVEPRSIERDEAMVHWTDHVFTVQLPPQLRSDGVKAQLRKQMSEHMVKILDEATPAGTAGSSIGLYYENLPFAQVTLLPGEAEIAGASRSDLRQNSSLLAEFVVDELEALTSSALTYRSEAEEREDLNALWRYTQMAATLPPGVTLGALKGRLQERVTIPDVAFSTDPNLGQGVDIVASIAGKPCVGLACTLQPGGPVERPEPVSLSEVLDIGIEGSEPVESAAAPAEPGPMASAEEMIVTPVENPVVAEEEPASEPATAPALEPEVPEPARDPAQPAQVAIIIDDGGNNSRHAERFLALDNRLTLAILPNTPFAVDTAERGASLGFEIMLHMPMETESATEEAVEGTLFTAMGKAEIQKLTNAALDQIPYVSGLNNHTGSKFTSNKKKMGFCLEVVKERGLFFVDSVTSGKTVAYATAVGMEIPAARRDVFLDNEQNVDSVRAQFELLKQTALKKGTAIGIGHFQSKPTATVLAEELPKLEAENIMLVHASELVQ